MIRSGIDEAGLGPILGPYCACAAGFEYPDSLETEESPWTKCSDIISETPENKKLAVGDSKGIYSPGKGELLERTVLAFHSLFAPDDSSHGSAWDFLCAHDPDFEQYTKGIPWYALLKEIPLPLFGGNYDDYREPLEESFRRASTRPALLRLTVRPAGNFNSLLASCKNKASACQSILSPLLSDAAVVSRQTIVDRQGGRRYYGDWMLDLFPGRGIRALKELKESSLYEIDDKRIEFRVKADATCFETALASLFAKYARELSMEAFNAYWQAKKPELKKTAGYYSDGQRFIKDLKGASLFPEDPSNLVRQK